MDVLIKATSCFDCGGEERDGPAFTLFRLLDLLVAATSKERWCETLFPHVIDVVERA